MWFVFFIVFLVLYFIIQAAIKSSKDNQDLIGTSLDKKFSVIVQTLNDYAYGGVGYTTYIDDKLFNLYSDDIGFNQIIEFLYSQGSLSITWKYKYYQKEMVYRRHFNNVRNLSVFEQKQIADSIIREMSVRVEAHKESVLRGI